MNRHSFPLTGNSLFTEMVQRALLQLCVLLGRQSVAGLCPQSALLRARLTRLPRAAVSGAQRAHQPLKKMEQETLGRQVAAGLCPQSALLRARLLGRRALQRGAARVGGVLGSVRP